VRNSRCSPVRMSTRVTTSSRRPVTRSPGADREVLHPCSSSIVLVIWRRRGSIRSTRPGRVRRPTNTAFSPAATATARSPPSPRGTSAPLRCRERRPKATSAGSRWRATHSFPKPAVAEAGRPPTNGLWARRFPGRRVEDRQPLVAAAQTQTLPAATTRSFGRPPTSVRPATRPAGAGTPSCPPAVPVRSPDVVVPSSPPPPSSRMPATTSASTGSSASSQAEPGRARVRGTAAGGDPWRRVAMRCGRLSADTTVSSSPPAQRRPRRRCAPAGSSPARRRPAVRRGRGRRPRGTARRRPWPAPVAAPRRMPPGRPGPTTATAADR
jgi:hypothetical protein